MLACVVVAHIHVALLIKPHLHTENAEVKRNRVREKTVWVVSEEINKAPSYDL